MKLFPLGEQRRVSGKLEMYGQELQIVHPDHVLPLDEADTSPEREAIYPLSEGITSKRMGQLAAQAIERAPELEEWVEPGLLAKHDWPAWRAQLDAWRARARAGYDGSAYERLTWTQQCFSVALVWLWDERLYDHAAGRFTPDRLLDEGERGVRMKPSRRQGAAS